MRTYTAVRLIDSTRVRRIFKEDRSNDVEHRDHSVQHCDFLCAAKRVQRRYQRMERQNEHLHDAQHPVGGSSIGDSGHFREEKNYAINRSLNPYVSPFASDIQSSPPTRRPSYPCRILRQSALRPARRAEEYRKCLE